MKGTPRRLSRRNFLLAAVGSSAAATAALVAKESTDVRSGAKEEVTTSKGYQLTEHVQSYYRTAKV